MCKTAIIENFRGFRYDANKLNASKYEERIEEAEDQVADMNSLLDEEPLYKEASVCQCCGKVIVNNYFGFGATCFQKVLKAMNVLAKVDDDFNTLMSAYTLKKWNIYANVIRELYIACNTNEDGTLKRLKNEFKKSFLNSMLANDGTRISAKQVDIMINDIDSKFTYAHDYHNDKEIERLGKILGEFVMDNGPAWSLRSKKFVIKNWKHEQWIDCIESFDKLVNDNDLVTFVRITYKKAWIDNPYHACGQLLK